MGESTEIAWTDATFNCWWGCARVSPACEHCYAESFAKRVGYSGKRPDQGPVRPTLPILWGARAERRFFGDKHWAEPLKWNTDAEREGRRRKVFCASMADIFEDRRDLDVQRGHLWSIIDKTPWLDWQLLTKRPEVMKTLAPAFWRERWPSNVWAGCTVETQDYAERRIPHLLSAPAAIRFLSVEPQLGPVDFGSDPDAKTNRFGLLTCPKCRGWGETLTSLVPDIHGGERTRACGWCRGSGRAIDWVIVGGESGPGARPFEVEWARSIVAQCRAAGVAVFVKQLGSQPITNGVRLRLRDRKGGDMSEWPEDLRVREFPAAEVARPEGRKRAPAPDPAATEGAFDLEGS